ncbi:neprilysin-like [Saccostrea echinata]|uniref:neprilysin-like n=1 Tax=Saccostrea echinata TaxID=191078 RepID=UPI002A837AB9|nr:neprilysin-like [Saccostrea echinata]
METNGKSKYYITDDPNQVDFKGSQNDFNLPWWNRKRTRLEIILIFICLICIAVTTILIVIETTRESDKINQRKGKESEHGICLTEECVKASARLLKGMDQTVDPCDDFFEYACGSWNKINVIPEDRSGYNTFAKLRDDLQVILKDLLEQPTSSKEPEATQKAKHLYRSCVNESMIEERGLGPVNKFLEELGGWPVTFNTSQQWDESKFKFTELLVKLKLYNNKIFVDQWVSADDKNSDVNIIQLDQPELGMPSRDYYLRGVEDEDVQIYEKFAINVAMMFGANETQARIDMREMVELEIELANITTPQEQRRDGEELYNRMTVKELHERIPGFNWLLYLNLIFEKVNITVPETEEIVVYAPEYLSKMVKTVQNANNRLLANYMIWRIMMNRVTNLPQKYRNVRTEYYKKIYGSDTERSRWRDCISYVNDNMGNAVGRLFVKDHFDKGAKEVALNMIHDIRAAFYDLLEEVSWLDQKTRKVAKEKAEAMAEKIGYPPFILNDTALDESYNAVTFSSDTYFENVLENIRSIAWSNSKKLREPVDKTKWSTTPVVVNAFYSSTKNQIMFPAGILQPPFYSKGYPRSLNYGGIGMVIGHEITHGFDDRGRQFDKFGNLKQWWDDEVIAKFKEKAQCIIEQYGNYTVPEVGINLNGVQTQGENIADNGGLKEAYRAYEKWIHKQDREPDRLPGLSHLSNKQLFFLNFAQVWCGTMRPRAVINRIRTTLHSPGKFRVIGTLQSMQEFAEVFNCPPHSYMNPVKKCRVW